MNMRVRNGLHSRSKTLGPLSLGICMLPMFPPMLAQVAEQPFDRPDWQFEVKWDGMRALAYVETGGTPAVFP